MTDSDNTQDSAAMSPASTGSVSEHIDVEELICELNHIAGSERIDVDVRRVACDAEAALARLRAWVNELQMSFAERVVVARVADLYHGPQPYAVRDTLRGLLERHK